MSKLTRIQRIEIYHKNKAGASIKKLSLEYKIRTENIAYLIRLMDKHGKDILRKDRDRYYPASLKEEIINKVLVNHKSIKLAVIEYGLSSDGILQSWIKLYKEN